MNIKKLIVLVGDEADSAAKALASFSVVPETIGGQELEAISEVLKDFPMQVKEHHVRHFFTKINKGTHAVNFYVGKNLSTQEEGVDYFMNTVARGAYGQDFPVRHFLKDFEYYKNGVYSCVADSKQAAKLKSDLGRDAVVIWTSKEPAGEEFDFEVTVNGKTKLKKDLLTILETLKERWT